LQGCGRITDVLKVTHKRLFAQAFCYYMKLAKANKMAKYTKQQMADALRHTKGQITLAARHLGCAYNTMRAYIDKYPELDDIMKEETAKMGDEVENALYDEAVNKRNTAALIFLAKTKFKHRGYIERQEVTGADGKANKLEITYVNRDED